MIPGRRTPRDLEDGSMRDDGQYATILAATIAFASQGEANGQIVDRGWPRSGWLYCNDNAPGSDFGAGGVLRA